MKIKGSHERINFWMHDPDKPKGCSKGQPDILRSINELFRTFGILATMLYFLVSRLGQKDLNALLSSVCKQREFIRATKLMLKKYAVIPADYKMFDREITGMYTRYNYVLKIVQENLYLTEYYPFFKSKGFDVLVDFDNIYYNEESTPLDPLIEEIEEWNAAHQPEILDHMRATEEERNAMYAYRKRKEEEKIAEKKKEKKERAEKKKEKKEMEARAKEERKAKRSLESSFDHLYIDAKKSPNGY